MTRLAHDWCIDPHHVWGERNHANPRKGRVAATWALHCLGRLDIEALRAVLDPLDPIGLISNWLEPTPGEVGFPTEKMIETYANKLIAFYGVAP